MLRLIPVVFAMLLLTAPVAAQAPEAALVLQHDSGVVTATWNGDETQILTATEGGLVQVWSVGDGELQQTIDHGGNPVTHALWLQDSTAILSADESGLVVLSQAADGEMLLSWRLQGMPIAIELNVAATQFMAFTKAGDGAILSLEDGERLATFSAPVEISGAVWSADETQVRAWTEDGQIYVWDIATGEERNFALPGRGMLLGLTWNADDTRVLAWFTNGTVNVYQTDGMSVNGRALSGARHRSFVQQAIWSRDESMVMSWAGDDTVNIWSVDGGRSQQVFRHEDWVIGARWDPAEARVLSWSHIYVYLWDSEQQWQRFRHRNLVRGAVWNSDATQVLSWSWDGTARVWNA